MRGAGVPSARANVADEGDGVSDRFHPSEYIREELAARGWDAAALADAMGGWSLPRVQEILAGNIRITKLVAIGLSSAFGTGAQVWMNLQRAWDEQEPR